jgi:hypothetical protein
VTPGEAAGAPPPSRPYSNRLSVVRGEGERRVVATVGARGPAVMGMRDIHENEDLEL